MNGINNYCFECGDEKDLQSHHVVPKSLGGSKTIELFTKCHGLVHDRDFTHHKTLQRIGIRNAKEKNVKFGRPKCLDITEESEFIGDVIFIGLSTKKLSEKYHISESTARRIKSTILNEKNHIQKS